jgi:hypothetical protein
VNEINISYTKYALYNLAFVTFIGCFLIYTIIEVQMDAISVLTALLWVAGLVVPFLGLIISSTQLGDTVEFIVYLLFVCPVGRRIQFVVAYTGTES